MALELRPESRTSGGGEEWVENSVSGLGRRMY